MTSRLFHARPLALAFLLTHTGSLMAAPLAQLPDVVIVGSRFEEPRFQAPTAIQVVTRDDIEQSAATSVPEALRMLAGVNVRSVVDSALGYNASVDLGGFGVTATQNTLILLDGRKLNPMDGSDVDWSGVALSRVQRIEIAQGAAGVQYGASSSGGVINIITDAGAQDRARVTLGAGSWGTRVADVDLDQVHGDVRYGVHVAASRTEGWRDHAQADSQRLGLHWRKAMQAQGYVYAGLNLSQQNTGLPGGVLGQVGQVASSLLQAAKFNNVGSFNTTKQTSLYLGAFTLVDDQTSFDVDLSLKQKDSAFVQPYYDTADSFNTVYGFVTGAGKSALSGDELTLSPKFRTEWATGHTLVYGVDLSNASQDGSNRFGALARQFILDNQGPYQYQGNILSDTQSVQLQNRSAYLLGRYALNADWDLSMGARRQLQGFDAQDLNKSSGAQVAQGLFAANAYELALALKLDEASRAYVRVNRSFRFANTDEYWGYDAYGNRVFSGELRPQTGQAFELGYDLKSVHQQLSVMLSQSTTQHEIRYNPDLYRNSNLSDDVDRTSLLAFWKVQVQPSSQVTLGVRWQKAVFANGAYQGEQLSLVPRAVYSLGWQTRLDARNRVGLQAIHVSEQHYDAAPGLGLDKMPAYTTLDAFWTHGLGSMEARLTVKNLTNTRYASYGGYGFVSMPGASGVNSYYFFPASPRSLMLSLSYRF